MSVSDSSRFVRLIPCLDVRDGRVVKGVRFEGLRDVGDPVAMGVGYAAQGADELVFLDISATLEGRATKLQQVRALRQILNIPLTVGGGVRNLKDAAALFDAGADKVVVNSAAVNRPQLISELSARFGSQAVVVAIDAWRPPVKDGGDAFKIRVHGGSVPLPLDAPAWGSMVANLGAGELMVTSWDCDGVGAGYDLELIRAMRQAVNIPLIASGGARTPKDLAAAVGAGADAVLIASMLHDGLTGVPTVKWALTQKFGCAMRPSEARC